MTESVGLISGASALDSPTYKTRLLAILGVNYDPLEYYTHMALPSAGLQGGSTATAQLSSAEIARYGRQMIMPEIGLPGAPTNSRGRLTEAGQVKLKQARVAIVGAGGLGCPCAMYLASSGVGHITIIDGDDVEISNLHRQVSRASDFKRLRTDTTHRCCTQRSASVCPRPDLSPWL